MECSGLIGSDSKNDHCRLVTECLQSKFRYFEEAQGYALYSCRNDQSFEVIVP